MDTTAEYNVVLQKKQLGAPVSWREVAVAIANHEETLLEYMCDNDYAQVYRLLHHSDAPMYIGQNKAKFFPQPGRCQGELKSLLEKKDFRTLNDIIAHYRINLQAGNITSNNNLIEKLKDINAISMKEGGYGFNLQFN